MNPYPNPGDLEREPINKPIDLNDPAQLIEQLQVNAQGMTQQVLATSGGTAYGGAPFPAQLYGRSAECMLAAVALIQRLLPTPKAETAPVPVKPEKAPAPKG